MYGIVEGLIEDANRSQRLVREVICNRPVVSNSPILGDIRSNFVVLVDVCADGLILTAGTDKGLKTDRLARGKVIGDVADCIVAVARLRSRIEVVICRSRTRWLVAPEARAKAR